MPGRQGFTLIELALVVVIVGILASMGVANLVLMQARAKEAEVKALAHVVQIAAEDFSARNDGVYSAAAGDLVPCLPEGRLLRNPFTGRRTEPQFAAPAATAGQVGVEVVFYGMASDGYVITGCGRDGVVVVELGRH